MIKIYQSTFSVFFGGRCRFIPSCSEYSKNALQLKGLTEGLVLSAKRLSRCHPFGSFGFDPVKKSHKSGSGETF